MNVVESIKTWKPTFKQSMFLSLPVSIKEACMGGGAGSGKTDVLMLYGVIRKWHENPLFKQVFLRRTAPELKREVWPRSFEFYRKFGATPNRSDMVWTFPRPDQYGGTGMANDGAQIWFGHCETDKDVHIYDSMQINLFTPEELTTLTEYMYLYIGFERGRAALGSGLPSIIRAAAVPGNVGHTWVQKRFPSQYGNQIANYDFGKDLPPIIVGRGGNKRIYIHATAIDNEYLDPNYKQSLQALPEAEKKAKLYGDWSAYLGQVFSEFREKHYADEPDEALHVVKPFDIPKWWPRIYVVDWGYEAYTYCLKTAISPTGRAYSYEELAWKRTKIEEWGAHLGFDANREEPRVIRFCQSIKQQRGEDNTIQSQIESAIGRPVELTGNVAGSRIATKALMHEFLRWEKKATPLKDREVYNEEKAMWILRNRGLKEYHAYLNSFNPDKPEILPRWQIFGDPEDLSIGCPLLINAIKACTYAKPKEGLVAEDVAEFDGDDPYDVGRYTVDAVNRFVEEASDEMMRVRDREAIIKKMEATADMTAYYRNLRKLEGLSDGIKPVRRYKHH